MSFLEFFRRNSGQILTLAIEHLWLVGVSVFLAVLIGVSGAAVFAGLAGARRAVDIGV